MITHYYASEVWDTAHLNSTSDKRITVLKNVAVWEEKGTGGGHLMALEALMISLIRGTPRVMFMEATPAKWKVFRVIWVPGSPMLWAQSAPTAEPGSICALEGKDMDEKSSKTAGERFWLSSFSRESADAFTVRKELELSQAVLVTEEGPGTDQLTVANRMLRGSNHERSTMWLLVVHVQ